MKTNQLNRRGFTLVELLVVIVIIASLAGLTAPMVIRQRKKADQTEAVNNARQIGLAMLEFETEYGSFPDSDTLEELDETFTSPDVQGEAGSDSNGYFKQLFQAGITQSEEMFYVKTPYSKKPDGDIDGDEALTDGEVGFGYIMDGDSGMSIAGNPARALVATPLNEDGGDFDGDPFDKKAVILRMDNSVTSVNIRVSSGDDSNEGPAILGGEELLDSSNPIWGGDDPQMQAPVVK
ncbi:type II secretion system protein [Luteolibacter sp. AS25]|uniref:type II secretion system protein n=1 Tax=Luteolibacter sp. AS25 TaxID=3135776 RepID=UPI00398AE7D5